MKRKYKTFNYTRRNWNPEVEGGSIIEVLSKTKDMDLSCPRFVKVVSTGEVVECLFQNGQWVLAVPPQPV